MRLTLVGDVGGCWWFHACFSKRRYDSITQKGGVHCRWSLAIKNMEVRYNMIPVNHVLGKCPAQAPRMALCWFKWLSQTVAAGWVEMWWTACWVWRRPVMCCSGFGWCWRKQIAAWLPWLLCGPVGLWWSVWQRWNDRLLPLLLLVAYCNIVRWLVGAWWQLLLRTSKNYCRSTLDITWFPWIDLKRS